MKKVESLIGKTVKLMEYKKSMCITFEPGDIVKITEMGPRGYTFEDNDGNKIIEAGFTGFIIL